MVRVAIVYYSAGGTVAALAAAVAAGATATGAQTRSCALTEDGPAPAAALAALDWADGLVLGTPACFGNVATPLKRLIDATVPLWRAGALADKVVGGFTAAGSPHGGHESTLLALFQTVYHWGSLIVPAGYTDPSLRAAGGNPYGVSVRASRDDAVGEPALAAAAYLGGRVARFAAAVRRVPVTVG
ncbi:flavodoxin family protein [Actinokineospora sp. NBRC 105648]|uniref:flavodoxin family protein n=1 Tax=Actinokineospora sp. NBRC 105648 TaxID=3032206 RepID=UPI0024A33A42|nr:flavodoxin family protein [Actinokineospora sp. NBRC 105648]GLZ42041.1 TrpR-binding protein WrbA [Actinokineospora sp. NBRC 105648]